MLKVFGQAEVGQAVADGDIWEAQRRAMQLSYANVRSKKAKIAWERNLDKHSLKAVGILKQGHRQGMTSTIFTKLITLNLMGSQITFLKVVCQWLSWQLIWIRMVQSTHYRVNSGIVCISHSHASYT